MDDIVKGTIKTLHILASKAQSRSSIYAIKNMPLFVPVRLWYIYETSAILTHFNFLVLLFVDAWQSVQVVGVSACVIYILHQKILKIAKFTF